MCSTLHPKSNMRILVTGGAGFICSHLVVRLMENEKNEVIVIDNYFTGSKDNLKKWIGPLRFELNCHDVTEPLLVEVDQIYHLACPASPIFYKYNPMKEPYIVEHIAIEPEPPPEMIAVNSILSAYMFIIGDVTISFKSLYRFKLHGCTSPSLTFLIFFVI